MTDELKDRKSYSPFPEDRHRTTEEKVRGNGLELAPEDVADQTLARRSGALNRPAAPPDPLDDDHIGSNPLDQKERLLCDIRDAQTKSDAEGRRAQPQTDAET